MNRSTIGRVGRIAALAITYAVVGRIGLLVEPVAGFATLVWPSSGIAVFALVVWGRSAWPGVALGALAVNLWIGATPPVACGIAVGNTLAALLAEAGLRRASFHPALDRVRDVLALLVVGALFSTLASASVGVATLYLAGVVPGVGALDAWRAWWLGDAMGDLVIAPVLFVASQGERAMRPPRLFEGLVAALVTAASAFLVFGGVIGPAHAGRSMYLLFPALVWVAVRFAQRGAAVAVVVVSGVAVIATAAGVGPFATVPLSTALLELQSFMAVVTSGLLLLGAAVAERDRARTAALDAAQAREDFLAIAGHELRTPLSTLVIELGSLRRQFERESTIDSRVGGALTRAQGQADRLASLLANLLDASRIGAGRLETETRPVDLAELVRASVDRFRDQAERAACELRIAIEGPVIGDWDPLRIEQVTSNLLSNAVRYASGAPIDVDLSVVGGEAVLSVRDHGPGIAPEQRNEIFERYQRGGAKRERGGLGLGLFIARSVAEALGGTLVAEPAAPGARFVLRLPVVRGSQLAAPTPTE